MIQYRADVDGLRAIAVVPVLFYHARWSLFSGGFVGVDVFFVISGYLITSLLLGDLRADRLSIVSFYDRRIRRIFPALFAVLFFCALMGTALLMPSQLDAMGRSIFFTAIFVSNHLFRGEAGYFDAPAEEKPLLHTWSLAVEEQFYILFPLFLFVVIRLLPGRYVVYAGALLVISFAASVWGVATEPVAAFYLAPFRAWELLLGSILAVGVIPVVRSSLARELLSILGLGAIAWSVIAYSPQTPFPGVHALLPCLGAAILIHNGASGPSFVRRVLEVRPLVFVGLISYSLYLWHWPLLVFANQYAIRGLTPIESALVLLVSFGAAIASWRYIERPFRDRSRFTRRALFSAAAAVIAAACAAGFGLAKTNGLPQRLSREILQLAEGANDRVDHRSVCSNSPAALIEPYEGVFCTIGAKNDKSPSFAIWGDSHAEPLLGALEMIAQRSDAVGFYIGLNACPPLLGVTRYDQVYPESERCDIPTSAAVNLIAKTESIETVILIARWSIYAEGTRYKHEKGVTVLIRDDQSEALGIVENPAVFERGLERTVAFLQSAGKKIVIVSQVPEVGWNVPSALARSKWLARKMQIGPASKEHFDRQRYVDDLFERMARTRKVRVIHPDRILCDDASCRVTANGKALYFDDDHLSGAGAMLLVDLFEGVLAD